ncbi:DUF6152 family protein [Algihabitans albus]|uniref:DUF6152 family protein n=1 Tax=Algihabitans albus TaxID=2164067 RepID=UPI0013C34C1F|nr:DUF6152 family protein [Algihabitans albus]
MLTRRGFLASATAVVGVAVGAPASAHHGWRWTDDGTFELTGVIREARLGNPHGILEVDAEEERWIVEVGQPWRNEQAGLTDALLSVGREIVASGQRASDETELRMKAERLSIDGVLYDLYPNRD